MTREMLGASVCPEPRWLSAVPALPPPPSLDLSPQHATAGMRLPLQGHLLQPGALPALRGPLCGRLLLPPRQVLLAPGTVPQPGPLPLSPTGCVQSLCSQHPTPPAHDPPAPPRCPQARCWTTSPTRAACPWNSVPAPTAATPMPRGPPSPPAAAPGRPPGCPCPWWGCMGWALPPPHHASSVCGLPSQHLLRGTVAMPEPSVPWHLLCPGGVSHLHL